MMSADALNRIEGIINQKPFTYKHSLQEITNSDIEFEHVFFSLSAAKMKSFMMLI